MTVFHYVPPCAGQQGAGENRERMWADVGETSAALVRNEKEIFFFSAFVIKRLGRGSTAVS